MRLFFAIIYFFVFFGFNQLLAQKTDLIIPMNHQKAIENGSRTNTGIPGERYFQNRSDYDIEVNFNPVTAEISGKETINYKNNSPDTLRFLVIRLYQNIFKAESHRQVDVNKEDLHSGVNIKNLTINGIAISTEKHNYYGTNLVVSIPSKQKPNSTIEVKVEWDVKLPNTTQLRMGRYDSSSYFVAYWYPQIAVYDDIAGWSFESYTGITEFYNDYGDFDVRIKVPKNYVVWATGVLQNKSELFTEKIIERIEESSKSDKVVRIITKEDYSKNTVFKENGGNVWHYRADFVSDFAFGVSDKYVWDGVSVEVDSKTKRRAIVNAVYKTASGDGVAEIGAQTIKKLSTDLIGIPYPYPHNTVWEGDGGMEFPMMCNDGPADKKFEEVFVTSHEISHSYFPFLVGTNETYYAWMDEGLITFIPKAIEIEYGNENAHYYVSAYAQRSMGNINDIPLIIPSTQMTQNNYMMQNYGRAATGFYFLHDVLGDEIFKNVLQEFVKRWEGKHPIPTDFVNTLNAVTKQDWAWFWNPWFYEFGFADLALQNVLVDGSSVRLTVKKLGKFPVPIKLTIFFEDNTSEIIRESTLVWKNSDEWKLDRKFAKPISVIELGDENIPDAFQLNNSFGK